MISVVAHQLWQLLYFSWGISRDPVPASNLPRSLAAPCCQSGATRSPAPFGALCCFRSEFADLRPQCLDPRFSSLASDKKVVSGLHLVLSAPPASVGRELVSAW